MKTTKTIKWKQPKEIVKLKTIFNNNGFKLFLVGGAVRDLLLGVKPKDYDLATDATPDFIEEILKKENIKTLPTGKKFGIINAFVGDNEFEIATFRSDSQNSDGRRPESVSFSTIDKDVLRRDLTINALFINLNNSEVVDLVGGCEDLKNGIIRTVGSPKERFREDRLRVIRAIRFATRLNFTLDSEIIDELTLDNSFDLISKERVRDEFIKGIRSSKDGVNFLRLLNRFGMLENIFRNLVLNKMFSKTTDEITALAFLLINNTDMKTVIKELKACRFKNFEIDKVVFLLNLRNFILGEGDLVKLKRKQELMNLNLKNVTPFLKICKLDRVTAKAFFNFKLSVTGISVMDDFNLTGKDISDKILELEVENFKITKQKAITKFMTKKRNVLDAQIDLKSLLKHISVNFTHGFLSGLAIAFVSSNIYLLIAISYYIFKRFDSLILNRDKYTTKLGQDYIFPIPSTIGFTLGCFISSIIGPLLKK